jgi:hypothetical protein
MYDMRVFNEALVSYADKFSFPPKGKNYQTTTLFMISATLLITFIIYV